MKNNLRLSPGETLFVILLCFALILPLSPIKAQEADETWSDDTWSDKTWRDESETTAAGTAESKATEPGTEEPKVTASQAAPKGSGRPDISLKMPKIQGADSITALISQIIGYISQIGAMFGKTASIRIGGTSVSAIAILVIAKLIRDRGPSWLKWLLYVSGGTMAAGSGANITQMIMRLLSQ